MSAKTYKSAFSAIKERQAGNLTVSAQCEPFLEKIVEDKGDLKAWSFFDNAYVAEQIRTADADAHIGPLAGIPVAILAHVINLSPQGNIHGIVTNPKALFRSKEGDRRENILASGINAAGNNIDVVHKVSSEWRHQRESISERGKVLRVPQDQGHIG